MSKPYKISRTKYMKIKWNDTKRKTKKKVQDAIITSTYKVKTKIFGYWYCDHCSKLHGKRVVEYFARGLNVCSVGRDKIILEEHTKESDFVAYCGDIKL